VTSEADAGVLTARHVPPALRYWAKTLVAGHPSVALPIARRCERGDVLDGSTEIVIEGHPRAASSFAAFRARKAIEHHVHAPAQLLAAKAAAFPRSRCSGRPRGRSFLPDPVSTDPDALGGSRVPTLLRSTSLRAGPDRDGHVRGSRRRLRARDPQRERPVRGLLSWSSSTRRRTCDASSPPAHAHVAGGAVRGSSPPRFP